MDLPFMRDVREKFIVLCEKGMQTIEQRTPLDMLREILRHYGPDSAQVSYLSHLHGQVNVCEMALTILCVDIGASTALKDSALRLFFMLSGEKIKSGSLVPAVGVPHWPRVNESLSLLSPNIRSPLYASTPQKQKRTPPPAVRSAQRPSDVNEIDDSFPNGDSSFVATTCRHDALYLYFSRCVGSSWIKPLCEILPDNQLVSVYSSSELEWLISKLGSLKKAVEDYDLLGNIQDVQPFFLSSVYTPRYRSNGNIHPFIS
ncbi:unnamed protein product [Gongylonema pulchrum]|uniref:CASPASE_P10 domain-containing protein n=1 Tax=Gongylonema pulchrum TaxID=637853 RepID=A0A183CZB8_9BILA|nr:unnamed protein product [Gongylonema pulchrum]